MMDITDRTEETKLPDIISASYCLSQLTEEESKELVENSTVINFNAGETIIKQGFVASNIMYIEEGLTKLDILNDNNTSTVSLIPEKSFIGIVCTFASRNYNFSATAIEKTRISIFDIKLFEKFTRQNGSFAFHLVKHMSALSSELVYHISKFTHKNIDGSLSILLNDFRNIYKSNSFKIPLNRSEIANMLGYSKESVINTFSKFNKEGIVKVNDKQIEILKPDVLKDISEKG